MNGIGASLKTAGNLANVGLQEEGNHTYKYMHLACTNLRKEMAETALKS
jgi:hypothetical protein